MRYGLLGPLHVATAGGDEVRIVRPKLRLLLAILLVRANKLVPVESLVDDMWGEEPPASAVSNIRTYIWSLRRLLSPADPANAPVIWDLHGYTIEVLPERLDVLAFERRVADGIEARRRGDVPRAATLLEEALGLWRGTAFQNVPFTRGALVAAARQLEEHRLTALEELFDARLALGRHAEVATELRSLVVQHPLRERLWGQMMLALYRDGRQCDALETYQRLRAHLVEELGVEPSQPLQTLQRQVLQTDPALALPAGPIAAAPGTEIDRIPRQLPQDVSTFIGRDSELSTLHGLLRDRGGSGAGPVVVIHGPPGVGKSALAVRAANLWSTGTEDAQLYVNLRGATPGVEPLRPDEALGRFLRALGVAAADVPHDLEEAAALFRTSVAGRRMLILLDNAASAAQVRPLLPGTSRSAVLVTSRTGMTTLDGAAHVALAPLDPDTSRAMLARLIGDARVAADPAATDRLATLCDHLPLGLQLAAARLKARPAWPVRRLADRLTDERHRLTQLAAGDLAMRSSLTVSYAGLKRSDQPGDRAAARALCLIGLVPLTDIDASTATPLLDTSPTEADLVIERLLDAHLLEEADQPDRYHMHDLIRLFTRELAADAVADDEADAAITRVLGHYLATTAAAVRLAYPHRTHYPVPDVSAVPKPLSTSSEARRWLQTEWPNLLAMIRQSWHRSDEQARLGIGLTLALHWFFSFECYPYDAIELNKQAVALARRQGDQRSEANAHDALGIGLSTIGRYEDGAAHFDAGLSLCRQLGDRFGEQRALGNLGYNHLNQSRPQEAISYLQRQLAVARQIGATTGEMYALRILSRAYHQLGQLDEAVRLTQQALAWYEQTGDDLSAGAALQGLGLIYIDLGRLDQATATLTRSVEGTRRMRNRVGEAEALISLARAWRLLRANDRALSCAQEAIAITDELGLTHLRLQADAEHAAALAAAR
jgi:DNA-binding SARP family transcriptional activator/tetratricopeptide (TPR) repeat protein